MYLPLSAIKSCSYFFNFLILVRQAKRIICWDASFERQRLGIWTLKYLIILSKSNCSKSFSHTYKHTRYLSFVTGWNNILQNIEGQGRNNCKLTFRSAMATWKRVSVPWRRKTSKMWKTKYRGKRAVKRVRNHWDANIWDSTLIMEKWCQSWGKCSFAKQIRETEYELNSKKV